MASRDDDLKSVLDSEAALAKVLTATELGSWIREQIRQASRATNDKDRQVAIFEYGKLDAFREVERVLETMGLIQKEVS